MNKLKIPGAQRFSPTHRGAGEETGPLTTLKPGLLSVLLLASGRTNQNAQLSFLNLGYGFVQTPGPEIDLLINGSTMSMCVLGVGRAVGGGVA